MKSYFQVLRSCFQWMLDQLAAMPHNPHSPFYERCEIVFFEQCRLLRAQAREASEARQMGAEQTFLGWAIPEKPKEPTPKQNEPA